MSKKLKELKEWAAENVTLVKLLPPNDNLEVTTRLIDVLEDEVDEKYYLSEEKTRKLTLSVPVVDAIVKQLKEWLHANNLRRTNSSEL